MLRWSRRVSRGGDARVQREPVDFGFSLAVEGYWVMAYTPIAATASTSGPRTALSVNSANRSVERPISTFV